MHRWAQSQMFRSLCFLLARAATAAAGQRRPQSRRTMPAPATVRAGALPR